MSQCDPKFFMSMENPLTPSAIEPATVPFIAQHVNHSATAVPKPYKSNYITELRAAKVTFSPTTLIYSTKLHGATPQKAIKLRASRKPIIPNEITITFVGYKVSLLSLIATYVYRVLKIILKSTGVIECKNFKIKMQKNTIIKFD